MNTDKHNFQKLTPTNKANIDIYRDALDFVFSNDELKKVALSGPYSAGKSSVLESYKSDHQDKFFCIFRLLISSQQVKALILQNKYRVITNL